MALRNISGALQNAMDRLEKEIAEKKAELADIVKRFETLAGKIDSKVDANEVLALSSSINKDILQAYGVKINESPSTPVSLENGKNIYVSRCSVFSLRCCFPGGWSDWQVRAHTVRTHVQEIAERLLDDGLAL